MSKSTRLLAAGAALLLVLGLGPGVNAPPPREAERGVRRALMRLNSFLAARDWALLDEFAKGEDTLLVGSESGEIARGREQLRTHIARIFALPDALAFSWREVEVAVHGPIAWLHAEGEALLGEQRRPYRLTGVFELQAGVWKWKLFHGSEPH